MAPTAGRLMMKIDEHHIASNMKLISVKNPLKVLEIWDTGIL